MTDQQKCQRGHDKIIEKFRPYINMTPVKTQYTYATKWFNGPS